MKPEVGAEGHPCGVGEGSQDGERVWASPRQQIKGSAFAANSAQGGGGEAEKVGRKQDRIQLPLDPGRFAATSPHLCQILPPSSFRR